MNVVFSGWESHTKPTLCMLRSMCQHNESISFYFVGFDDDHFFKTHELELREAIGSNNIDTLLLPKDIDPAICGHCPPDIYLKLLFCYAKPEIDRFLWCDSDVIIRGSISPFYKAGEELPNDIAFLGTKECFDNQNVVNRRSKISDGIYLNAGFIFINSFAVRASFSSFSDLSRAAINARLPMVCPEQEVIGHLFDGHKAFWPDDTYMRFSQKTWLAVPEYVSRKPVVIHFGGPNKPWLPFGRCSFRGLFWKYGRHYYSIRERSRIIVRRGRWYVLRSWYKYIRRSDRYSS